MDEQNLRIEGVVRRVAARGEWRRAHEAILKREKELTEAHDCLAAERRKSPWLLVEKDYAFDGPAGTLGLGALFAGRRQLIVYHHMLKPQDPEPCSGCGMVGDQIPHLSHLHQRDTELVFVSRAPYAEIVEFRERMGWQIPWYSAVDPFHRDFDVTEGFGLNVFYRDGDAIYRTYFTTGRGVETLGTTWTLLDLTPLGRQEKWEDAPSGTPQTAPYTWWRLHDEYDDGGSSGCCA
jgi:predicted dithiol-disulfide oxidoreductase (DUF899 family)